MPRSFHINWGSTKANCHPWSLSRRSWSTAIWNQVPLHKIQRAPKHLSDTGSHPPCVGCQNTLFIQLIPFLRGVLQTPYRFSFWGGNSIGGMFSYTGAALESGCYDLCHSGRKGGCRGPSRLQWPWVWNLERARKWKRQGAGPPWWPSG